MLIKVIAQGNFEHYISENDIREVIEVDRCGCKFYLVERIERNTGLALPVDKNEPFKAWLDSQIGGDKWEGDLVGMAASSKVPVGLEGGSKC